MPFKKFRYGTVSIKMMQNQIGLRKSDAVKLFYAILLSGLADDRHTLFLLHIHRTMEQKS